MKDNSSRSRPSINDADLRELVNKPIVKLGLDLGASRINYTQNKEKLLDLNDTLLSRNGLNKSGQIKDSGDYRITAALKFNVNCNGNVFFNVYKDGGETLVSRKRVVSGSGSLTHVDVLTQLKVNDRISFYLENQGSTTITLDDENLLESYLIMEKI